MTRLTILAAALALSTAAGLSAAASAESVAAPAAAMAPIRTITVSGHGVSNLAPDAATLNLGVSAEAPTAAEALKKNAEAMTAVIEALKTLGFGVTDIQTNGLGLSPVYSYENNTQTLQRYQATNGVTLRVKDIARIGEVLDLVVAKGANQVNGLSFDVSDKAAALNDARARAIEDAKAKADMMAKAVGASVGKVVNVSEGWSGGDRPVAMQSARADAATPIAPGEIGVEATVSITYELN